MVVRELITVLGFKVDDTGQKQYNKDVQNTKDASDRASKSSTFFSGALKAVSIASAVASTAVGIVGYKALELASDLTEVQNVVDTTFGEMSGAIDSWAKDAITQFGLSELEAKKFNGTMGALLKSSGITGTELQTMSTTLSGLAGDMASFYNLDTQTAFDKLRAGISGETEPLKQLGINMSEANLEAFALSQGITTSTKSMSQAEKTALRYNYIMMASADAQGDFNKTLETSFANQKRVLSTNISQTLATVMKNALPYAVSFTKELNRIVTLFQNWMGSNPEKMEQFWENIATKIADTIIWVQVLTKRIMESTNGLEGFKKFFSMLGDVGGWAFRTIANSLEWIIPLLDKFANVLTYVAVPIGILIGLWKAINVVAGIFNAIMAVNPITWIILAIVGAIVLIGALITAIIMHWDEITDMFKKFGDWCINLWHKIVDVAKNVWGSLVEFFTGIWDWIKEIFSNAWNGILDFMEPVVTFIKELWGTIVGFFTGIWDNIKAGVQIFVDWFMNIWNTVSEFFSGLWEGIGNVFNNWIEGIKNGFFGFIDGIKNAWQGIKDFFGGMWDSVVNFFGGGDDTPTDTAVASTVGTTNSYASAMNSSSSVNNTNNINVSVPPGTTQEQALAISRQVDEAVARNMGGIVGNARSQIPSPEARRY